MLLTTLYTNNYSSSFSLHIPCIPHSHSSDKELASLHVISINDSSKAHGILCNLRVCVSVCVFV
jgi:hypothetical protein